MSHAMNNLPTINPGLLEWITAEDGHRIPLHIWDIPSPRALVHIVHGMAEHGGAYADVASRLNAEGYAVAAQDHRCHGLATNPKLLGDVSDTQHWPGILTDSVLVNTALRERYAGLPLIMLGHSMGSFISQHFAQNNPDKLDLLILEGSGFQAPWFTRLAGFLGALESKRQGVNGRSPIIHALSFGGFNKAFKNTRTDFDWLSRDPAFINSYLADPLCGFRLSNGFWQRFVLGLSELYQPRSMQRMHSDLPIYAFAGDCDPVGHMGKGVKQLVEKLKAAGCHNVTMKLYPNARHDVLHEVNRKEVMDDMLGWVKSHLS